jgi:hypothetical protein
MVFIVMLFMGVFGIWLIIFLLIVTHNNMRELEEENRNKAQTSTVDLP